jgi:hypothetical protein
MPFHNPYHFVPVKTGSRSDDLPVSDFESGKVGQVTHDRFVSKAGLDSQAEPVYSGRLICRLVTEDPIVIGAQREDSQEGSPARVSPFELSGRPAIPASTLRGLISSIAETASNSALRILEDRPFSYRERMEESLPALGIIVQETDRDGKEILKLRPLSLPPLR